MRILEEFWYGNIEPTEYDTSSCKEYKKLLELICRNSYKNKLGGWNVVKTKEIRLPEKNGKIDFAFMDTFISAIKKLAIKEVVLYSDRKIAATKELVSKNNQLNS